ncbi:amino acid permease-associated protein [Fictibacillus macauensis ZFHKF-1]|uniref:Amino acid permease-associated protein n=1 Tax=Fictibacillus macauensis ZFHKF-1 TaxID=1196324 RepID=I8AM09_9BACL|nr:APC family permease [Fictibacillus macauensis]EIT86957.1 amino acid permease-associated protein [Fictibacillus macauensis ZFHKF-1]
MADQSNGSFKRRLSTLDLTFLGLGSIIGSGWLYAAATGAKYAGPYAWISWLLGAVIILLIGLVYAELGAALPVAGGFVRYPDYTHGSVVGFLIGFISMLAYSAVISIESQAVRGYLEYWFSSLGHKDGTPTFLGFAIQIGLIVLFFILNYWSVAFFGKLNTILTVFKFIVPSLIIIVLLFHFDFSNFSVSGAHPGGAKGIFAAVTGAGIVFAFNGFRQPIEFAEEAKNPSKSIPLSIIFSILIGLAIYMLLQVTYIGAVPSSMLSDGWAGLHFKSPWADLASALGIVWLANLVLLDAVISPSATGNIYFSATARSLFAWAKNGYFFKVFQKIDKRSGLPRAALWLTLALAIIWMLPYRFQAWADLVDASTSLKALTFVVGPVSMMALRQRLPDLKRPFLLRGAKLITPLAFMGATLVIYWSKWKIVSFIIPIIIISLVFYFIFTAKDASFTKEKIKRHLQSGWWLIAYYIFLLILSYIGSYGPGNDHWISAPWDTAITAILSLFFYVWGVRTSLEKPQIDMQQVDDENA